MLDDMYEWAIADDSPRSIRWLHGPAGAGKSAIMQTLCQRLQEANRLGGSFFFKRGHTTQGNAKVLFATLAYQLALHNRDLTGTILRGVEKDSTIVGRHMDVQLRKLIIEPCRLLTDAAPLILLIDGLDECEDDNSHLEVLRLLRHAACEYLRRFRILIASRPEPHIRETFDDSSFHGHYDSVNVEQSFEDIRKYLHDEFARIHREHQGTMRHVATPWPSSDILSMLVKKSSGYFVFASTVIKFIDDKNFRPTEQLKLIQNLVPSDSESPFGVLDQLYIQILSGVPKRNRPKLSNILCAIANFSLHPEHIDQLLGLSPGDVRLIIRRLHSVLNVPSEPCENEDAICMHHASFLDFLHDEQRSTVFHVGPGSQHHTDLARLFIKAISSEPDDREVNQASPHSHVKWKLGLNSQWIPYITLIPNCAELLPLIRLVNPDFMLCQQEGKSATEDAKKMVMWLKEIRPVPEDLSRVWKGYRLQKLISPTAPGAAYWNWTISQRSSEEIFESRAYGE
ncbi:hypothetical protein C8R44DRAFT_695208 [Mycena epipterygia]|nr:hypothetical protein C8R44DRAFT_695208 [Mycena epipterygia]